MILKPTPYPHYLVSDEGDVYSTHGDKVRKLKPWVSPKTGHLRVRVFEKYLPPRHAGRRYKDVGVHVLVCTAFHGPRPDGALACHWPDRNPADNRPSNLCWGTHQENTVHRLAHEAQDRGQEGLFDERLLPGYQTDPELGF